MATHPCHPVGLDATPSRLQAPTGGAQVVQSKIWGQCVAGNACTLAGGACRISVLAATQDAAWPLRWAMHAIRCSEALASLRQRDRVYTQTLEIGHLSSSVWR